MKTSFSRPDGTPEEWPVHDWLAWFVVLQVSELALLDAKPDTEEEATRAIIEAVEGAAVAIDLEGGAEHWLVRDHLAGRYGIFFDSSRGVYTTPDRLMRYGTAKTLNTLGPENVDWAKTLAKKLVSA